MMEVINKYLKQIVVMISVVVIAIHNIMTYPWANDDAFISYRYAENFALGHGFVFNVGERVEGYTTFLWVAILGLGKTIGFDIIFLSRLLGVVFSIGCILLLVNAHHFIEGIDSKDSIVAALFLGTCGIFTPWATSGMEVAIFTFFLLLVVLLYYFTKQLVENKWRLSILGIVCAVLAMVRPEGGMIFAIIFIDQLIISIKNKDKAVFYLTIPFIAVYLPYFTWRYSYYGYLLPNTFYAKVGSSIYQLQWGLKYFAKFVVTVLFLLMPWLFTLFSRRWFKKYNKLYLMPVLVIIYSVYIILVGGDYMPAFRFFVPILPILCIISALSISLIYNERKAFFIIIAIVLSNIVQMRINPRIYNYSDSYHIGSFGKDVGLWLKANVSPDTVIAVNAAGSIPYFSKLRTIDMLGLNDEHIAHLEVASFGKVDTAHSKGDGAYVLSKKPDYIQFGGSWGAKHPTFLGEKELHANPMFHKLYSLETHTLGSKYYYAGRKFLIYKRRESGT